MRRFAVAVLFALSPLTAQAACSDDGYTIVFINGVFDTKSQAKTDQTVLQKALDKELNNQQIKVILGYNQTHLAGASDLYESYFPAADSYDLIDILTQMHDQVHTRKLLIVGHSQGAIYANQAYEYLVTHGEPKESVAVYAVATPESYVAGGGSYRNYALDTVLNYLSGAPGERLLPYNITGSDYVNSNGTDDDLKWHHSFSDTYLALFPDKLVSDMNTELWLLKSEPSSATDGCFDPPTPAPAYYLKKGAFTLGDPMASVAWAGLKGSYNIAIAIAGTANELGSLAYDAVSGMFSHSPGVSKKGEAAATFTLLHALNLTSISGKDAQELLSQDQGGAAILAILPGETPSSTEGEVLGVATDTVPQDIAMAMPFDASTTPELSVPIPQPNPAIAFVSHSDSQGGSGGGAEVVAEPPADAGGPLDSGSSSDTATTSDDMASSTPPAPDPMPPTDTTPPSIVSVLPAWGSIGVAASVPLRLVYDEALDAATIDTNSVHLAHILTGFVGWEATPITVSLESDGKTIDIAPLGVLSPGEYYSLSAGETITDLAGNRSRGLASPVTNPEFQVATTSVVD